MSKIRILPEILSNKIAAGEVVERPSSIVKELVENAVDAGSTKIIVEIENGGRSLIRISDNGSGMNHDDALLALERYATSKIYSDEDLFSISTMGFRGEALPSIASVSKFSLVTKEKNSSTGTKIIVEGGKIKNVDETGAPTGTMVCVKQLFFNTPARRKFLKTVNTEMGHIADTVAYMALGWPGIHFRLTHNKKVVKSWPKARDHFDRALDVLGHDISSGFHKIEFNNNSAQIIGWISSPKITRSSSRKTYIYVNNRFVKDRGIQHAIYEGYQGRLMKGQFPVAALFINLPFDELDVNVHPTKHEVRFARQKEIYEAVKSAVVAVWETAERPKWNAPSSTAIKQTQTDEYNRHDTPEKVIEKVPENITDSTIAFKYQPDGEKHPQKERTIFKAPEIKEPEVKETDITKQRWDNSIVAEPIVEFDKTKAIDHMEKEIYEPKPYGAAKQTNLWEENGFTDLKVIGQFHNTYILCDSGQGLVLIDQHAAHERVLFENLKKKSSAFGGSSQKLLIPETIELGYSETVLLEKMIVDLKNLGFEVEPFGGNTFVVKALPSILSDKEAKPLILEMIDRMDELGFVPDPKSSGFEKAPGFEKAIDECLILMACHGSIRANQALSQQEMEGLLNQLDQCDNPSHCPHGRPTWIRWTLKELEKSFNRIV